MTLHLRFAAISDVGRIRKDNQDSGYAGPWLLAICDGVGGAARGDLASSTALGQIRNLDSPPSPDHTDEDLIALVAGSIHRAHDRISELIETDPALSSTSTTATVGLFDGEHLAIGHVGDSRAYLLRGTELSQLSHDHTFVQTLVDEGRITDDEARYHPNRNLILRAIDGQREAEPDLFVVPLQPGDRLMFCSDGVCGSLADPRIADILGTGTPDYAAVELVRASLDAGSSDNVTCVVADVTEEKPDDDIPQLVGAAAELRRRKIFKGHRNGDTGELEALAVIDGDDEIPPGARADDPIDPEAARYAPRPPRGNVWLRRILIVVLVVGLLWAAAGIALAWSQRQFFVGVQDGEVMIYRGLPTTIVGIDLAKPYESTGIEVDQLSDFDADAVADGVTQSSRADAEKYVNTLATRVQSDTDSTTGTS
ncbi:PP2C family protein-serine/threonine phosphatase [Nocardioides sp. Kera G14]|uniref:PP2C family protein-serine/threonine phosphatase n=1 Tax=Nocardioides sp. Kera G14 TaxID=2884264 RepID=UPI001D118BC5|nr:protein phosphatase 2C domain-containing protein [Nocardioides sp. Kera G14]UDY23632.1 protein phosphatase 2C domain-containing protein [Nocardioides sp. Kera G14]